MERKDEREMYKRMKMSAVSAIVCAACLVSLAGCSAVKRYTASPSA